VLLHGDASPLRERLFERRQVECIRPVAFAGGSQHLENLKDLVNLTVTREQGATLSHLSKNAASGPQINSQRVGFLAEQDLRASVPECNHLVGVGFDRQAKGTGQTEISQLDLSSTGVDQQVLGFQISVENAVLMAVDKRMENLEQEALGLVLGQGQVSSGAHVLLQVELTVLEDQPQFFTRVDNFVQLYDVRMLYSL